jgi:hypothetical protein
MVQGQIETLFDRDFEAIGGSWCTTVSPDPADPALRRHQVRTGTNVPIY